MAMIFNNSRAARGIGVSGCSREGPQEMKRV